MLNKDIIVVAGRAGSGKNSLADKISAKYGYKQAALADPLKELVTTCLNRPINKATDREFLVDVGQYVKGIGNKEFSDKYGSKYSSQISELMFNNQDLHQYFWTNEFWVQLTKKKISDGGRWIIPDMRFEVEYRILLRGLNPVFTAIDTPENVCEYRLTQRDGGFFHKIWESPSEKEWINLKYDIKIAGISHYKTIDPNDYWIKNEEEIFLEFEHKLKGIN